MSFVGIICAFPDIKDSVCQLQFPSCVVKMAFGTYRARFRSPKPLPHLMGVFAL